MRFNEILNEEWNDEEIAMAHGLSPLIKRDCQPFLSQINDPKKDVLWRGIQYSQLLNNKRIGKINARLSDRRPSDTKSEIHSDANVWFIDNHGLPWRNGVFAVGSSYIASGYGDAVYSIFPIGDFKYIWSPKILDLYSEITDVSDFFIQARWAEVYDELHPDDDNLDELSNRDKIQAMSVYDMLEKYGGDYINTDLTTAIKTEHEIMLWCETYYCIEQGLNNHLQL